MAIKLIMEGICQLPIIMLKTTIPIQELGKVTLLFLEMEIMVDTDRNSGDGKNAYGTGKSHICYEYCHYKGHTKETCFKLHGYPKRRGGAFGSHTNNATTGGTQLNASKVHDSSTNLDYRLSGNAIVYI